MGCHFSLQGNLPDPGIKPTAPTLAGGFLTSCTTWEALSVQYWSLFFFENIHLPFVVFYPNHDKCTTESGSVENMFGVVATDAGLVCSDSPLISIMNGSLVKVEGDRTE